MPWDEWSRKTTIAFGEEPEFRFNLNGYNRIATWLKDTRPQFIDPRSSGRKLRFLAYSRYGLHENLQRFGVQMLEVDRIYRTCQEGDVQIWRYKAWVGKPVQLPKAKRGAGDEFDHGSHTYSWLDADGEEQGCSVDLSLLVKLVPTVAAFQQRLRETRRSRLLFDDLLHNLQGQAGWESRVAEREQLIRESAPILANP
jgi:hypothetical protein